MLLFADQTAWDEARRAWNLAVDQHPAAIAQPATVDELQEAVRHARDTGLRIAPQATGHGAHALGPLDDVLLLKTSRLNDLAVADGAVHAGAGVLAAAAADAAGAQRRAPMLGFATTVGVAGLTVGGGIGWLSRLHGLAANNVRAFDVVLADGERERVDHTSNPDLFWALRGGGGRGAIVTGLELETHAVPALFGGAVAWPIEHMAEVLEQFRRCTMVAPEALTLVFRAIAPAGLVMVIGVYVGTAADATAALAPLRSARGSVQDTFGPIAPQALVRVAGDPEEPSPGHGDGFLLDELTLDASERIVERFQAGELALLELRHLGGALARTPRDHGALARLDGAFSLYTGGMTGGPELGAAIDELRAALTPWVAPQALLNTARAGVDPATGFDPATWERLCAVRDAYDPERVLISAHDLYAGTT